MGIEGYVNCLVDSFCRHIGQTVTVFTESGGVSGCGFTGVLLSADCSVVRLLTDFGAPPACPIGSECCCGNFTPCGYENSCNSFCGNPLGSVEVDKNHTHLRKAYFTPFPATHFNKLFGVFLQFPILSILTYTY